MNATRIGTLAIVALLLIAGAAAVGAASPAEQSDDVADERTAVEQADATDGELPGASDDGQAATDGVGPSDGLPDAVPDHVRSIHETIGAFLSGAIDGLGDALSDRQGNGAPADDRSGR